ncbi:hypothetical protein [Limnoglobus roseus]|uniref:Uncharacterized protein n=1 Tax=Limnoglobus roseus TaxID=2598579 RepID=A0A5C1A8S7_9BACT|nr:hypothetical protein [Limnoglobus roseus]QEL14915.1 hypothetical protein PX52LOC_01816 [Limnoglobus roseus]
MHDYYLCLTLLGRADESESAFKSRLYAFWTHILRNRPDDYEGVYSEAVEFEEEAGRVSRQYMIQPNVADAIAADLTAHGVDFHPVDRDDHYSKAEASSSEWFQLD